MRKPQKSENGITLISLVVMSVIILILVVMTSEILIGQNGIIKQATDSVEETKYKAAEEKIVISISGSYDSKGKINDEYLIEELRSITDIIMDKEGNIISSEEKTLAGKYPIRVNIDEYEFEILSSGEFKNAEEILTIKPGEVAGPGGGEYLDSSGNSVQIPEGGKVSTNEGEQSIKDGLVMQDKDLNEWVWIEVPKTIYLDPLVETETDYENIEKNIKNYVKEYTSTSSIYKDEWIEGFPLFDSEEEYLEMKNKVLQSIYVNKGFWTSRYEIGTVEGKPVSNLGVIVKNNITLENAQTEAKKIASNVTLMFGFQWDLILKFIEVNSDITPTILKTSSSYIGNYMDNNGETISGVGTAGQAENSQTLNINDIAGNVWEMTLETNSTLNKNIVYRGGNYSQYSQYFSAYKRLNNINDYRSIVVGFRVVLY